MSSCHACNASFADGSDTCPVCGWWLDDASPACDAHPETPATGCCVVCGRPLCERCEVTEDGVRFCEVPDHREVRRERELLLESESEFEADWVVENLAQNGIMGVMFSAHEFPSTRWTPMRRPARVFVQKADLAAAREALVRFDIESTKVPGDAA